MSLVQISKSITRLQFFYVGGNLAFDEVRFGPGVSGVEV